MEKNRLPAALPLGIILSLSFLLSGCTWEHKENTPKPSMTTGMENSTPEVTETAKPNSSEDESEAYLQKRLEEAYENHKHEDSSMTVKIKKSQVELQWEQTDSVSYCILYRYDGILGNLKNEKLLAKLPMDQCSYIDRDVKVGKNYVYSVHYIKEMEDGATEFLSLDSEEVAIGPGRCEFTNFYNYPSIRAIHFDTTTQYIRIPFNLAAHAMKQDGYEIYRGKNKKDMKKIAVVKSGGEYETYKDTDVTPFATYYYSVRTYKKIDGKTYYGSFAGEVSFTAGNSRGKFVIEKITDGNDKRSEQIIKMTSDEGNYDFEFDNYSFSSERIDGSWTSAITEGFENVQYSFDGADWKNFTEENVKVSKGESIYLLLRKKDNQPFRLDSQIGIGGYYPSDGAVLQIDFREDTPIGKTVYEYFD